MGVINSSEHDLCEMNLYFKDDKKKLRIIEWPAYELDILEDQKSLSRYLTSTTGIPVKTSIMSLTLDNIDTSRNSSEDKETK